MSAEAILLFIQALLPVLGADTEVFEGELSRLLDEVCVRCATKGDNDDGDDFAGAQMFDAQSMIMCFKKLRRINLGDDIRRTLMELEPIFTQRRELEVKEQQCALTGAGTHLPPPPAPPDTSTTKRARLVSGSCATSHFDHKSRWGQTNRAKEIDLRARAESWLPGSWKDERGRIYRVLPGKHELLAKTPKRSFHLRFEGMQISWYMRETVTHVFDLRTLEWMKEPPNNITWELARSEGVEHTWHRVNADDSFVDSEVSPREFFPMGAPPPPPPEYVAPFSNDRGWQAWDY